MYREHVKADRVWTQFSEIFVNFRCHNKTPFTNISITFHIVPRSSYIVGLLKINIVRNIGNQIQQIRPRYQTLDFKVSISVRPKTTKVVVDIMSITEIRSTVLRVQENPWEIYNKLNLCHGKIQYIPPLKSTYSICSGHFMRLLTFFASFDSSE